MIFSAFQCYPLGTVEKTWGLRSLLSVLGIFLFVTSCSQAPTYPPTDALFGDSDVAAALTSVANMDVALAGFDGGVLPDGQTIENPGTESELSSQAVLANSTGFIVYIRNDPASSTEPWQIYRYDQAGNKSLKIFGGTREIQSVAVSGDGNAVLATMRATTTAGSPFDVFKFVITPKATTQLTTTTIDERNVSISADGSVMVWQGVSSSRATVFVRQYTGTTFTQSFLNVTSPQLQPSVSGDGGFIALIRQITAPNSYQVLTFRRSNSTYTTIASSTTLLEHPSVSNGGTKVVWLENAATDVIKMKTIATNTTTNIISSTAGLDHPVITATGKHLTYSQLVNNSWNVKARDLTTNLIAASTGSVSPVTNKGAYWQDVGFYIEPGIVGKDWTALNDIMSSLPLAHRQNVIYVNTDSRLLSNKTWLKRQAEPLQKVSGNLYRGPSGITYVLPSPPRGASGLLTTQNVPLSAGQDGGTGAYRRVMTEIGTVPSLSSGYQTSFAYARAQVYLPGGNQILLQRPSNVTSWNETAYAMFGGRSTKNGSGVTEVDLGFTWDSANGVWRTFLARYCYSGATTGDCIPWANGTLALNGDVLAITHFYVPEDGKVCLFISGVVYAPATKQITPSAFQPVQDVAFCQPAGGWKASGEGNRIKRETSLAQGDGNDATTTTITNHGSSVLGDGIIYSGIEWQGPVLGGEVLDLNTESVSGRHRWGQASNDIGENVSFPFNANKVIITPIDGLFSERVEFCLRATACR